jgi:hypothetical protein
MKKIELNMTVYHKDIYDGKESMKVIGIRNGEVELEGDYSGGTHAVTQSSWMSIDGLLFEKPKEELNIDIHSINGHEIVNFLIDQLENNEDLRNSDIRFSSPEFVEQTIRKFGKEEDYVLTINAYCPSWTNDSLISDNKIIIGKNKIYTSFQEPFCDDGSDYEIKNILFKWLKTHKFQDKKELEIKWRGIIEFCQQNLTNLSYEDKERLDNIIKELNEAKTLM